MLWKLVQTVSNILEVVDLFNKLAYKGRNSSYWYSSCPAYLFL